MACLAFPAECEYTVYMEAQERQTVNSKEYDPTENDGMHRDLFERSSIVQAVLDLLCKQYWTGKCFEANEIWQVLLY